MTGFYGEHSKVFVSVDCIVFGFDENKLKRNREPRLRELGTIR